MEKQIPLNGAMICTEEVNVYGVYRLDIDDEEKIIECRGFGNGLLATIFYYNDNCSVECIDYYDDNGSISNCDTIVDNGRLVI